MKGGPIDLTPFGAVVDSIAIIYWIFVAFVLYFAWRLPKIKALKIIAVLISFILFSAMPVHTGWQVYQARKTLNAALVRFEMRCKSAGEKIAKTVDNVDGIFLMKIRPKKKNDLEPAQFKLDDPYGDDYEGDAYIISFLQGRNESGRLIDKITNRPGYQYVEAVDPTDRQRYRYIGYVDEPWKRDSSYLVGNGIFTLKKTTPIKPGPRYAVTYDDISTRKDRELWIAGSSLRIIDLENNEVIAERIGYMIDLGQGSKAGFRDPWAFAANHACPSFPRSDTTHQSQQTRNFVEKVLKLTSLLEK